MKIFKNRQSAGKLLAKRLKGDWGDLGGRGRVLGIPRGGVVVAAEVAHELKLPLDILIIRKIGAPFQEELALGAVDPDGEVLWELGSRSVELGEKIQKEWKELKRREDTYRGERKPLDVEGKTVILVDDGIATGATSLAAINYLKRHGAQKIILAVPVASREAVREIRKIGPPAGEAGGIGEVVILEEPEYFEAVGQFYQEFLPVSDEEVISLLK